MSLKHEQTLQKRIDLEGWGSRVDYLEDTHSLQSPVFTVWLAYRTRG